MADALNNSSSEEEEEKDSEPEDLFVPTDLLSFVPSPKKRDVATFTEEFSFVILPHIGLAVVYITAVSTGLSGYCNDLRQAIKLKTPQEPCPYITYTAAEKRDPVRNVCPGLWGPYTRVNDNEETIRETQPRNGRNSSATAEQTAYPATCFLLIPKLSVEQSRISVSSVEEQVQQMATYCNDVYVTNLRQYQQYNHQPQRSIQKRSFGLARQPNRTNSAVHNGLPLNKFITRRHAVEFLTNAYGCDSSFYDSKTSVAQRLLHPPHTFDEKQLGYPFEGF